MHTKTKTLSPAAANRALIARWRRYRLNGPDAILPLARCPHHVLAAEVLRKVGFTNNAERLTESGVLAVLEDR